MSNLREIVKTREITTAHPNYGNTDLHHSTNTMVIPTIWQHILHPRYVRDEQNQCTKLRVQRYYFHEGNSLSYYLQHAVDVVLSSYISERLTK